jgi:hypothetical protein
LEFLAVWANVGKLGRFSSFCYVWGGQINCWFKLNEAYKPAQFGWPFEGVTSILANTRSCENISPLIIDLDF